MNKEERQILPESAIPRHYNLSLDVDMKQFTFKGRLEIFADVVKHTNKFWVNNNELSITNCHAILNGHTHESVSVNNSSKEEYSVLEFSHHFSPKDQVILAMDYHGKINDTLSGFYRSSYTSNTGETKYMASTQFEATDARKAFPCWDEPNMKATFTISITLDKSLTALSNMNVKDEISLSGNQKKVIFAETPKMSTYLVAFIVGDLEFVESFTQGKIPVRIYSPKEFIHQAKFASEITPKILDYFNDYFGIPYPLPKLDLVAIPDFSFAAMENWGLVTFQNAFLLFEEGSSSLKTKQTITMVVGHELAHQWFGNLVTMDWWSDLWLNEGFATWIGWLVTDVLFPEWHIWSDFMHIEQLDGLDLDSLSSSHPIQVPVNSPADISEIFDAISYSKGASVIRMLETHLGHDVFKKGLQYYLKKHQYGNTFTNDLWNALSHVSGQNVSAFMDTWTRQMGYPLLSVKEQGFDLKNDSVSFKLSQQPFVILRENTVNSTLWQVPLGIYEYTKDLSNPFSSTDGSFSIKKASSSCEYIWKLNERHCSFYRVLYPTSHLANLCSAMDKSKLHPEDILGLINDAFNLAYAGYLNMGKDALKVAISASHSMPPDYMVWTELDDQLCDLESRLWMSPNNRDSLHKLIQSIFSPMAENLGWGDGENSDERTELLRTVVLFTAGIHDDQNVIKEAKRRFELSLKDNSFSIPPNYRELIYAIVVKYGTQKEYDAVWNIFSTSQAQDEKTLALKALTYSQDLRLLERTMNLILKDDIKLHDITALFKGLSSNILTRRSTLEFFKTNYDMLRKRMDGSLNKLSGVVGNVTSDFTTVKDLDDIKSFFESKNKNGYQRTLEQSIENIKITIEWLKREESTFLNDMKQ